MIRVYQTEATDGLANQLQNNSSVALAKILPRLRVEMHGVVHDSSVIVEHDTAMAEKALGLSKENFDLFPIHTILVSTGWNKNDDVFLRQETWAARNTPEDKPFNLGHDPSKIIGHITGSVGVDENYQVLADDLTELPDHFHILTRSVIYKHIGKRNEDLQAEVDELISGIGRNEWFVSMEALFTGFDYGFIDSNGHHEVIARQESTAFLTKHLRMYGGTGEYGGRQVGRVLRDITFSGKALVENPANPESIIFNDTTRFQGVLANDTQTKVFISEAFTMSDEILRDLKDQNASLEQKLAAAMKKLEEMGEAAVQAKLDARDRTIVEFKDEVEACKSKISELQASVEEITKSRDEAVAAKIEAEENLSKAEEKIKTSEAETLKTSRISVLVDKGVDKAEAEKLVATFDGLEDDKFESLVAMQAELVVAKSADTKPGEEEGDEDSSEAEGSEDGDEDADKTDAETDKALNDADADTEEDPAMASEDNQETDELQQAVAGYLGNWLTKNRKQEEV